ncbi:MAG: hypothetical protein HY707_07400 [Ignavibacteriae bacterium]|nr:hypothetical protein [Ignavibacteriota bacterium]
MKRRLRAEVWGTDMDRYVLRHPMVEIDGVLIDVEAFFKTRSGCDKCGKCCTFGTSMPKETAEKLQQHLPEIAERYIPPERRPQVGWHFSNTWNINYTNIVKIDSRRKGCCFLYKSGDQYLCSIYSWALETQRDPFEYWPFECIMYPIAIIPYKGILHDGKTLLTLRMPQTWHIVDIYGPTRSLQRSVVRRLAYELKNGLLRRLHRLGLFSKSNRFASDCYFQNSGYTKPLSYVYFSKHIRWYFGDEFYEKMCEVAQHYLDQESKESVSVYTNPKKYQIERCSS